MSFKFFASYFNNRLVKNAKHQLNVIYLSFLCKTNELDILSNKYLAKD